MRVRAQKKITQMQISLWRSVWLAKTGAPELMHLKRFAINSRKLQIIAQMIHLGTMLLSGHSSYRMPTQVVSKKHLRHSKHTQIEPNPTQLANFRQPQSKLQLKSVSVTQNQLLRQSRLNVRFVFLKYLRISILTPKMQLKNFVKASRSK